MNQLKYLAILSVLIGELFSTSVLAHNPEMVVFRIGAAILVVPVVSCFLKDMLFQRYYLPARWPGFPRLLGVAGIEILLFFGCSWFALWVYGTELIWVFILASFVYILTGWLPNLLLMNVKLGKYELVESFLFSLIPMVIWVIAYPVLIFLPL